MASERATSRRKALPPEATARAEQVTLRGGPCDGARVTATVCKPWVQSAPLLVEDSRQSGTVARYRPSREKGVYSFREYVGEREGELAADLQAAGFYVVSYDVAAGRRSVAWALEHVRRTIPKRNERGQAEARVVLDKWEADYHGE